MRHEKRNSRTVLKRIESHGGLIQETKLKLSETQDWNMVGRGFLEGFLAVHANGQSRAVIVAWNKMVLTTVDARMGQFSVAIKLKRQSDDFEIVVVFD